MLSLVVVGPDLNLEHLRCLACCHRSLAPGCLTLAASASTDATANCVSIQSVSAMLVA